MHKHYINANELLLDSFKLAVQIHNSDFRPDFIVAIWRGGTPVGIAIQEMLAYLGNQTDHIAIRTSSYEGIDRQTKTVRIHGLSYLVRNVNCDDKLLLVDDVFDSGKSIEATINTLRQKSRKNTPHDIRVAVPWYKPGRNNTERIPDYYIHKNDNWLVFPHELDGLEHEEIFANKVGLESILAQARR